MEAPVFPLALKLQRRAVVVLGGGAEASDKVSKLLDAGACVTVLAEAVEADLAARARRREIAWFAREATRSDLAGAFLVLCCVPDPLHARELRAWSKRAGCLFGAVDQPDVSDFFLTSTLRRGPLTLSISTGGAAPLLARAVRESLARGLGPELGTFATHIAALRRELRHLPKEERRARLAAALNGFAMDVAVSYPQALGVGARAPSGREP